MRRALLLVLLCACSRSRRHDVVAGGAAASPASPAPPAPSPPRPLPARFQTRVVAIADHLFVIAQEDGPPQRWLFESNDGGAHWRPRQVGGEVETLAGRGQHWAVLTHGLNPLGQDWAVLDSRDDGQSFTRLPLPGHDEPAYYDLRVEPDDAVTVWGLDWIYRRVGAEWRLIGRLPDAAAQAEFPRRQMIDAVVDQDLVLVNPFLVYRLAPVLEPFSQGLAPPPEGLTGVLQLTQVDGTWIAASHDGTYLRRPGDGAWSKLDGGDAPAGGVAQLVWFANTLQRALAPSPFQPGEWIVADNQGLRADRLGGTPKRLWQEPPGGQIGLISSLATTRSAVAAGFYRAHRDAAGVVVGPDGVGRMIVLP